MARTANRPTRRLALERRRSEAKARQKVYDALPQAEKDKRNPKKAKSKVNPDIFDVPEGWDGSEPLT